MHPVSSVALSFKARVLRHTSARVAQAGSDPASRPFARAMLSLRNSEEKMYRQHWQGRLSAPQLLARTQHLAQLRLQLWPSPQPIPLVREMDDLLSTCGYRQPLGMDDAVPPARTLQVFLDPDARAARACNALATAFWRGELNDFEQFRTAFGTATQADWRDPDRAAALHRAAVNALHDRTPKVGQGREAMLLKRFITRLVPVQSGHARAESTVSRVARDDRAHWWETAMLGYSTDSESGDDGSSLQDGGWETDHSGFSVVLAGDEAYV